MYVIICKRTLRQSMLIAPWGLYPIVQNLHLHQKTVNLFCSLNPEFSLDAKKQIPMHILTSNLCIKNTCKFQRTGFKLNNTNGFLSLYRLIHEILWHNNLTQLYCRTMYQFLRQMLFHFVRLLTSDRCSGVLRLNLVLKLHHSPVLDL